jgi:hypothetical protein
MNELKRYLSGLTLLGLLVFVSASLLFNATCTGSDPCNACKNCKYCKHCAKDGGKCGICKGNSSMYSGFSRQLGDHLTAA